MKRFLKFAAVLATLAFSLEIGKLIFPVTSARLAIALADEVTVQRVFINRIDEPARLAPGPISLRGERLSEVQRDLKIVDGEGITCLCRGDFRLRFKRFGLTLLSFRGHLSETPPRLISSRPLNLEPQAARRLAALCGQIAPR